MYLVTTIDYTESFLSCVDWEELPLYQDLIINKRLRVSKVKADEEEIADQMMAYMRSDRTNRNPKEFIVPIDKKAFPTMDNTLNDVLIDLHINNIEVDIENSTINMNKFTALDDNVRYLVDVFGFEILIDLNRNY